MSGGQSVEIDAACCAHPKCPGGSLCCCTQTAEKDAGCPSCLPLRWGSAACDNADLGHTKHAQKASGLTWTDADVARAETEREAL